MGLNKILLFSIIFTAKGMVSQHLEPHLANSLNHAINVQVEFNAGSYTSNPINPPTTTPSTGELTTTSDESMQTSDESMQTSDESMQTPDESMQTFDRNVPPCWTKTTQGPTTIPPSTIPPCWTQTTPSVSPMPPPKTENPGLGNFFCDTRNNFYAVPDECDTFIECKENAARKHFCPEGLVYKPSTIWPDYPCVLKSEYQCLNGSIIQPANPSDECPHQDGYYAVPNSDCSQYVVCQHGIATLMNCPLGLVFNEEKSICDWLINVPSCHPEALRDVTCPTEDETETDMIYKFRYYNSCTNYIACQAGFPRLLSCPSGLRFDFDKQMCVNESDVTNCEA